jgi:RNA polymerase sigma factor (sigma-70 family)
MVSGRSDEQLVHAVRRGETSAFSELWERHSAWAIGVAGRFTRWRDHDDVAAEAYTRTFRLLLEGQGPTGSFRAYLYVVIRNLAVETEAARRTVPLSDEEGAAASGEGFEEVWNRALVVRAFRSLPERWRLALWYTEVEGMPVRDLARHLGISANSAAALSLRAREGLRRAWLRAHVGHLPTSEDCRWALGKLPIAVGGRLRNGDRARLSAHLADCVACRKVETEIDEQGTRLAYVLAPPLLAGALAGAADLAGNGSAAAATAGSLVAPAAAVAGGTASGSIMSGLAAAAIIIGIAMGLPGDAQVTSSTGGSAMAAGSNPAVPPALTEDDGPAWGPSSAPLDTVEGALGEGTDLTVEGDVEAAVGQLASSGDLAVSAVGAVRDPVGVTTTGPLESATNPLDSAGSPLQEHHLIP